MQVLVRLMQTEISQLEILPHESMVNHERNLSLTFWPLALIVGFTVDRTPVFGLELYLTFATAYTIPLQSQRRWR
jgi:hypothetical protein